MSNTAIYKRYRPENPITLFNGDCFRLLEKIPDASVDIIITSPPYCMKKAYEDPHDDIETFRDQHARIFPHIYRILKPGGSVCWQVGYHIAKTFVIPLDYLVYDIFTTNSRNLELPLVLRNRIIWSFGHGLNSTTRFSGRHETILWFTKGSEYSFDLDSIRVPQKYPGKRAYKGPQKGELSGNPLGKNPSDVWDISDVWEIPNVKAQHIEKTEHPCQFPVVIPQRLIRALTPKDGLVLDPFVGSGTTGVAATIEKRRFIGAEMSDEYYQIAFERILKAKNGKAIIREDMPVIAPNPNTAVAKLPDEFRKVRESR